MAPPVVIDAMVALRIADEDRFDFGGAQVMAPRLLISECRNVLHRSLARRGAADGPERILFERILAAPITFVDELDPRAAWDIASLVGWRKTYDAEYLAAARAVGGTLCTIDRQMRAGAERLGIALVMPQ